jgi:hypothetical protein
MTKTSSKKTHDKPKCSHYKKSGHNESKCWQKYPKKKPKKANSMGNSQNKGVFNENEDFSLIMSAETALFNRNEESTSNWILDSAATHYICYDKDLFTEIEPYEISLK